MDSFKDRFLAAAAAKGYTKQTAMAESLGLPRQTINRWMVTTTSVPTGKIIFIIANAWHINAEWLCTGVGNMIDAKSEGTPLTLRETELLLAYRACKPSTQKIVLSSVKGVALASL